MHQLVVEQAEISRRYRDEVHPKFWGRIIGSSADAESAEWLADKFRSVGTPAGGLELEAVYVGLGSEADFAGRDVAGKAVFTYSMLGPPSEAAWRRAAEKGAAVVFDARMLPGNMCYQAYPSGTEVPAFTLGGDDDSVVRELIENGEPVSVSVRLDVKMAEDLETSLVWGTLPGESDETIYLMAHRDGWFDASGDNASPSSWT